MPSIKDYKDRLRLLENHIGSLRKQNGDLLQENQLLKNQLTESHEKFSSTSDKLKKMEELLTEKTKQIEKLHEQAKGLKNGKKVAVVKPEESVAVPEESFEIELGVDNDCDDLENCIQEFDIIRYELVKVGKSKYKCPIEASCTFQADVSKMHEHTRKHTGERPFQCRICDKYFVSKSVTRRHIRGKHLEQITSLKTECMNTSESEKPLPNEVRPCSDEENFSSPSEKLSKTRYSLRRSNAKRKILEESDAEINSDKRFKPEE